MASWIGLMASFWMSCRWSLLHPGRFICACSLRTASLGFANKSLSVKKNACPTSTVVVSATGLTTTSSTTLSLLRLRMGLATAGVGGLTSWGLVFGTTLGGTGTFSVLDLCVLASGLMGMACVFFFLRRRRAASMAVCSSSSSDEVAGPSSTSGTISLSLPLSDSSSSSSSSLTNDLSDFSEP